MTAQAPFYALIAPMDMPAAPEHPIEIPPEIADGAHPAHPIYYPDAEPTHPIALPPTGGTPPDPNAPHPAHPIAPGGDESDIPHPSHPIVLPPDVEEGLKDKFQVITAWTPEAGWVVVLVPNFAIPTPSK